MTGVCQVDFQLHLETETVEQAYPARPVCAGPGESIRRILRLLKERSTGAVLLCENQRLVGIFTERDALRVLADDISLDQPVANVMSANPVTLRPKDTLGRAIVLMSSGGFRRLPIVDSHGKVLGLLKVSGVLRYLVEQFPKVIYTLPPTPHHHTNDRHGA
jgi:CBS domain-containing protein